MEIRKEKIFLVSKTYETRTEEEEERGFIYKNEEMDIEEILREIGDTGLNELSSSWIEDHKDSQEQNYSWLSTADAYKEL